MTEQEFLLHHQLTRNPFSDEDAQTDAVFRDFCISGIFHPSWSKVVGDASQPATSIVFGPKGSGKTAIRLQLKKHIASHNEKNPGSKVYLVELDDFNAYLGPFQQRFSKRVQTHPEKVLQGLHLWDHMDAILSEAMTPLVDQILGVQSSVRPVEHNLATEKLASLDRGQKRDLLLLASIYDRSSVGTHIDRIGRLRSKLRFYSLSTWFPLLLGILGTLMVIGLGIFLVQTEVLQLKRMLWFIPIGLAIAWSLYAIRWFRYFRIARRIVRNLRVIPRDSGQLRGLMMRFSSKELDEQPLPVSNRSDDRYALLEKLQLLLRSLGYPGMIVIVDRVDEPDLVNGLAERMKLLVWPLLDNKLLKHDHFGIKMLLPSELQYFVDRETREFHERARLDKQNVVPSFDWTGEALYDLLAARMKACANTPIPVSPRSLFESGLSEARMVAAFQSLGTPRNLFRFMYRLITEHCKRHRSETPQFQISVELFEATLALAISEDKRTSS
ncbi:MAG: hypothetical protein MUD03_01070 [Pirellula sp.]|jgi:hypothetical protein|nr:hypothetical protein [Pirellula sp.]